MKYLPDALLIVGAVLVSVGAGMAWLPGGIIVAGALMIYAGIRIAGAE